MRDFVKKALTKTVTVKGSRGRSQQVEIPPNQRVIYGVCFAVATLMCLTILEATYIVVLRSFSSEIFAAITLVVGTLLGAFFGQKA